MKSQSVLGSSELKVAEIGKCYLFAGDESWHYLYCCCLSPTVEFTAHIKAPHHVGDRQYIFSRTGDHDSCCLVKLRLRSLWITMQGICLHVGWCIDLKALVLACNCSIYVYALLFLWSVFQPPHLVTLPFSWVMCLDSYHFYLKCSDLSPCAQIYFRRSVISAGKVSN